jgi:hypothetical protein
VARSRLAGRENRQESLNKKNWTGFTGLKAGLTGLFSIFENH